MLDHHRQGLKLDYGQSLITINYLIYFLYILSQFSWNSPLKFLKGYAILYDSCHAKIPIASPLIIGSSHHNFLKAHKK